MARKEKRERDMEKGITVDEEVTTSIWTKVPEEVTEIEKKKLVALAIKLGVIEIMGNHMYEFGGKTFVQTDGGSIGLRMTGSVARIVMDRWASKMQAKLENNKVKTYLFAKYVDDLNIYVEAVNLGSRWTGRKNCKLEFQEKWETEDMESNKTKSENTMEIIRDI